MDNEDFLFFIIMFTILGFGFFIGYVAGISTTFKDEYRKGFCESKSLTFTEYDQLNSRIVCETTDGNFFSFDNPSFKKTKTNSTYCDGSSDCFGKLKS